MSGSRRRGDALEDWIKLGKPAQVASAGSVASASSAVFAGR